MFKCEGDVACETAARAGEDGEGLEGSSVGKTDTKCPVDIGLHNFLAFMSDTMCG
jgi:hypothetical protein